MAIQNISSANPASKSVAQNYLNTGARRESRCCRVRHVQHHGGERPVESEDRGREQNLTKLKKLQAKTLIIEVYVLPELDEHAKHQWQFSQNAAQVIHVEADVYH